MLPPRSVRFEGTVDEEGGSLNEEEKEAAEEGLDLYVSSIKFSGSEDEGQHPPTTSGSDTVDAETFQSSMNKFYQELKKKNKLKNSTKRAGWREARKRRRVMAMQNRRRRYH